jgi:predicted HicB family RNase H-like nuclease
MTVSKAQQKATAKYIKNNYDEMKIRIKKGAKQLIETAAKAQNESINGYVKKAIQTRYAADTGNKIEL